MVMLLCERNTSSERTNIAATMEEVEVSREEHLKRGVRKQPNVLTRLVMRPKQNRDEESVRSDNDAESYARFTVGSNETIKASNRTSPQKGRKLGKGWFRAIMGVKTVPEESISLHSRAETKKQSPARRRINSLDHFRIGPFAEKKRVRSNPVTEAEQSRLDQSIRGRLDGLDVLSLGPADRVCNEGTILPWTSMPERSFTGNDTALHSSDIVTSMLWSSGGRDLPEIILEGFPGQDRWSVKVEQMEKQEPKTLQIQSLFSCLTGQLLPELAEETENDYLPSNEQWLRMWGSETTPISATGVQPVEEEDPLLYLASEHSIPIDLDENTFCVSERTHLETIHTFVAVALSMGRFQSAILILEKLMKGMDEKDRDLQFLKGATLHNIGVIYMWRGDFHNALDYFHQAVQERTRILPRDHADIGVSLVRKGQAMLALGRFDEALFAMELALPMTLQCGIARAKVFNNMGVVRYLQQDIQLAMKDFTASMELQRLWLDCSIQRDAVIYDACITLSNMGKVYLDRTDYDLAYYVYEEALLLQSQHYRKDHDLILTSLTNLGITRARQEQLKDSLKFFQGCLRCKNGRFGKESRETIDTIGYMGCVYDRLELHGDALKCMQLVKKWQKENLEADHPSLRKTRETIDKIEESLGGKYSIWV
jgi:tetratricopeptide (TPR) repeat protein